MVGDRHEGLVLFDLTGTVLRGERLGQGLAGIGERILIVKDRGFVLRGHLGGLVDQCRADDILIGRNGGRGVDEVPFLGSGRLVEALDQGCQGVIAVLAEGGGILDLHERDHRGVELVDRGDDLRLLTLETLRIRGTAGIAAAADGDVVALAVVVVLAARELVTGGGEVVEDVEAGEADLPADGLGGLGAGVGERGRLHRLGVVPGQTGRRLETPFLVIEAEHDGGGEVRLRTDADRVLLAEVGQGDVLIGLEEVHGCAVVEDDLTVEVLGFQSLRLGGAGAVDVGGLVERALTGGEDDLAVRVRVVVVGHGQRFARLQEHAFERFALFVSGRKGVFDGFDRLGGFVDRFETGRGYGDLGLTVVFGYGAGDLDVVVDVGIGDGVGGVDEDAVGRCAVGTVSSAGARSLDVIAVQPALGVGGGDDTAGGHGLALDGAGVARALDVGDRRDAFGSFAVVAIVVAVVAAVGQGVRGGGCRLPCVAGELDRLPAGGSRTGRFGFLADDGCGGEGVLRAGDALAVDDAADLLEVDQLAVVVDDEGARAVLAVGGRTGLDGVRDRHVDRDGTGIADRRVLGHGDGVLLRLDAAAACHRTEGPPGDVGAGVGGDFDEVGREGVGDFGDVDVAVCGRGRDGGSRREDESGREAESSGGGRRLRDVHRSLS